VLRWAVYEGLSGCRGGLGRRVVEAVRIFKRYRYIGIVV
jgi:hypothetical protein